MEMTPPSEDGRPCTELLNLYHEAENGGVDQYLTNDITTIGNQDQLQTGIQELGSIWTLVSTAWILVIAKYTNSEHPLFAIQEPDEDWLWRTVHVDWDGPVQSLLVEVRKARKPCNGKQINTLITASTKFRLLVKSLLGSPLDISSDLVGNTVQTRVGFSSRIISAVQAQLVLDVWHRTFFELTRALNAKDMLLRDLNMMPSTHTELISKWNSKPMLSSEVLTSQLVGNRVNLHPNLPAVRSWDGILTYRELDQCSTRLAHHLLGIGVSNGAFVGLCFQKSAWTIVAMLATLKAGAAFVHLDPNHPPQRVRTILESAHVEILVSQPAYTHLFENQARGIVSMDDQFITNLQSENFVAGKSLPQIYSSNAAYVVFTSGSTGSPKGIIVEHGALATAVQCLAGPMGIGPTSRMLQFAAYTFDVSVGEVFVTLSQGGCLCVPSEYERLDDLAGAISKMEVNVACLTPSVVRLLRPEDAPSLTHLSIGGEAVPDEVVKTWADRVCLSNVYGPSECTIWCLAKTKLTAETRGNNIGYGLQVRAWVSEVEAPERMCPIGCVGELVLEGPMLARGYLQAEQTRAAFINGKYRTGDVVRYNEDGSIAYIGRKDGQVKVRGHRIELGELEHHMLSSGMVARGVVLLVRERLVAVVCLKQTASRKVAAGDATGSQTTGMVAVGGEEVENALARVREALAAQVPGYMVPQEWVAVQSIPLLPSGKLNRSAVADLVRALPDKQQEEEQARRERPRNAIEEALAGLWTAALGIGKEHARFTQSFMRCGGDSLSAIALVRACRAYNHNHEYILAVTLQDLLMGKTIRQLADENLNLSLEARHDPAAGAGADADVDSHPLPSLHSGTSTSALEAELETQAQAQLPEDRIRALGPVEAAYVCTPAQQDLLLVEARNGPRHRSQFLFRIDGHHVDISRFEAAWQTTIKRHAVLRTVFVESSAPLKRPLYYQLVLEDFPQSVHVASLGTDPDSDVFDVNSHVAFPPNTPAHRMSIYQCQTGRVYCHLEISHALYDGISFDLLQRDLIRAYDARLPAQAAAMAFQAFCTSHPTRTSPSDLAYWGTLLSDVSPCFFPAWLEYQDKETTARDTRPQSTAITLDTSSIHRFCADQGITPAPLFHAAWSLVLKSFTGQEDVCFAYATAGRDVPLDDIDEALGMFINTLVCRANVGNSQKVADLLQALQIDLADGLQHQHISLADIQHRFEGQPLFNSLISFQRTIKSDKAASICFKQCASVEPSGFDLNVIITAGPSQIDVTLQYTPSILSTLHARDVLASFEQAIYAITEQTDTEIAALGLVSQHDRERIQAWNGPSPVAVPGLAHSSFELIAMEQPDLSAVEAWDGAITYAALDQMSTILAKDLISRGTQLGAPVPYCFEKSKWTSVAIMAILKSGGVCVALDPSAPRFRLQELINITKASTIVASVASAELFDMDTANIVQLGTAYFEQTDKFLFLSNASKCPTITPKDAAFILFTSGSTGKPKAIEVPHSSVCSQAEIFGDLFELHPGSRVLQFAAYTFDVSMLDIMTAFARGACLCVPSDFDRMNRLAGFMNEARVTTASLTPAVANLLKPSDLLTLRVLNVGGEAVTQQLLDQWADALAFHECYGPAEVAICTLNANVKRYTNPANVGTGVSSWLWIVDPDDYNRLLPVGAVGELLVEGPFVAHGYWNDPERTAASFVRNPAWGKDFDRSDRTLYRTGDLVQYNSDGSLTIHGRRDSQIKINGRRVEVTEIETLLMKAVPTASEVAVELVAISGRAGKKRLAAFFGFEQQTSSHIADSSSSMNLSLPQAGIELPPLMSELHEALPAYMVPSLFIGVTPLPKTKSGKVDRKGLRQWAAALLDAELARFSVESATKESPKGDRELLVQQLWSETLGIEAEDIGREDHFFRIGGDSALAMQLVSLSHRKGWKLSVADVFQTPLLLQLAEVVQLSNAASDANVNEVRPFQLLGGHDSAQDSVSADLAQFAIPWELVEDIYPCTPLQSGLMALSAKYPGTYTFQTVYQMPSELDLELFISAWAATVELCQALRMRVILTENHGACQAILDTGIEWLEVEDLEAYLTNDSQLPMSYGDALNRFAIAYDDDSAERYFIWTAHHTVYDGLSLPLILNMVESEYKTGTIEPPSSIAPLVQYIQSIDSQRAASFWTDALSGFDSGHFPTLPSHVQEVRTNSRMVESLSFERPKGTSTTTATLLRAAWALVLSHYSDSEDVVFGVTSTGRSAPVPGIATMVGPAIATVPVRIRHDKTNNVQHYLDQVQAGFAAMIPYEQAGLQYVRSLGVDLQRACDFRSLFVVQPRTLRDHQSYLDSESFLGLQKRAIDERAFHPYPLVLECYLGQTNEVTFCFEFDDRVLDRSQVALLCRHLAQTAVELDIAAQDPTKVIGDIDMFCQQDASKKNGTGKHAGIAKNGSLRGASTPFNKAGIDNVPCKQSSNGHLRHPATPVKTA